MSRESSKDRRRAACVARPVPVMHRLPLIFLLAIISLAQLVGAMSPDALRTCEPIRIDLCKGLGYNATSMPNLVSHESQQDAELQFATFLPLIQYHCSSQLKFFLCSVYVPMCTEKVSQPIGPCRPLCESVKDKCQAVLQEFGFFWPSALNCSKFPVKNDERHMCMSGPKEDEEYGRPYPGYPAKPPKHAMDNKLSGMIMSMTGAQKPSRNHYGLCSDYKFAEEYFYRNLSERCAHKCKANILFSEDNKQFAETWTLIWSILCCISTLFTLLTFVMETSRIHYSERVIVFMSASYFVYSLAYFVRLIAGRDVVACHLDSQHHESILIQEGLDNVYCTIVFALLYYFTMASMVWWVVLTITWFLDTGRGWTHEAIERCCSYFHAAAWGLPALKVTAILVMRVVDGDELTGTCYVGNQSKATLMGFVILPSAVYLALGVFFILAALLARSSRRKTATALRARHHSGPRSHHSFCSHHTSHPQLLSQNFCVGCSASKESSLALKSDTLNLSVLVFAAFYILPAGAILGANIYEYMNRDDWYRTGPATHRPNVEVFIFKIFMSLVVGMKTGLWVWSSRKPVSLWRKLASRTRKQPLPAYLAVPVQKQVIITTLEKRPTSTRLLKPGSETTV